MAAGNKTRGGGSLIRGGARGGGLDAVKVGNRKHPSEDGVQQYWEKPKVASQQRTQTEAMRPLKSRRPKEAQEGNWSNRKDVEITRSVSLVTKPEHSKPCGNQLLYRTWKLELQGEDRTWS